MGGRLGSSHYQRLGEGNSEGLTDEEGGVVGSGEDGNMGAGGMIVDVFRE